MTSRRSDRAPALPDETEAHGDEGFVGRWLRRKRAAREGRSPAPEAPRDAAGGAAAAPAEGAPAEQADADLPPLDSLDESSSYSDFLSPRVSEALRRQALRKLFMSAKFNITDGLDDYAEDYRTFQALGDIITSDMRYAMRREAEKARARSDSARPAQSESEAEEAADARDEDGAGPAATEDPRPQRAEGEEGDETGSA